jgi:hypothetical protein
LPSTAVFDTTIVKQLKKLFYFGLLGLLAFEILNVYFIMPLPGSQRANSIAVAYFLHSWRWVFRSLFAAAIAYGFFKASWKRKWVPVIPLLLILAIVYVANFKMSADHMFYQPRALTFSGAADNKVDTNRLVIGVVINDKAKAYPIQFIGYHHMVQDTVDKNPVLVTYCTVCRTGRVFDPVVDGHHEQFRLVGMDHFNAMIEDAATGSWWRQATGEAVAGKKKGQQLQEILCSQVSLGKWLRLYPSSLIMQEDTILRKHYNPGFSYENGTSRSVLTGTDTSSWKDKSWVVGVRVGDVFKAYDWNMLISKRWIADKVNASRIIIVLSNDNKSFFGLELPSGNAAVSVKEDTIIFSDHRFKINGTGIDTSYALKKIPVYQEFWHSWRTFHPATLVYKSTL